MKIMINRAGQSGILLEIFLLILILVLFTMFWNSFSRMTFLAGLLQIDDESFKHTCSNMVQVIIGTDYIISFEEGEKATQELIDYLGFAGDKNQVPDANHFYSKVVSQFPSLEGRVGVTVIPSYPQGEGFVGHAGPAPIGGLTSLFIESFKSTTCEFPLYSINASLTAKLILEVLI